MRVVVHNHLTRDAGLRKSTIAKEAARQLEFFQDMFKENHWDGNAVSFHANSANNYLRALKDGGLPVPEWIERNSGYLKAHGWRW